MTTRSFLARFYGLIVGFSLMAGAIFWLIGLLALGITTRIFPYTGDEWVLFTDAAFYTAFTISGVLGLGAYWTAIYFSAPRLLGDRFLRLNLARMLAAMPIGLGLAWINGVFDPSFRLVNLDKYLFPILVAAAVVLPVARIWVKAVIMALALVLSFVNVSEKIWPDPRNDHGDVAAGMEPWTGPLMLIDGKSAHVGSLDWKAIFSPIPEFFNVDDSSENYSSISEISLFNAKDYGHADSQYFTIALRGYSIDDECPDETYCKQVATSKFGPVLERTTDRALYVALPNGSLKVDPSNDDIDSIAVINSLEPVDKKTFVKTISKLPLADSPNL